MDELYNGVSDNLEPSAGLNKAESMKAKYGKVYRIVSILEPDDDTTIEKEYFFKKPSTPSYDRYVKTASQGATKALRDFILDNVTSESQENLENDIAEYPAMVLSLGEKLLAMLGLSKQTNLKIL